MIQRVGTLVVAALAVALFGLVAQSPSSSPTVTGDTPSRSDGLSGALVDADLVIVAEGRSGMGADLPGCGSLSVLSLNDEEPVFRGVPILSTSRIVANPEFTRVLSSPWTGGLRSFYELQRPSGNSVDWRARRIRPPDGGSTASNRGALHLNETGDVLLTTLRDNDRLEFGLGEIRLTDIFTDEFGLATLPTMSRHIVTEGTYPSLILSSRNSDEVHVITEDSRVFTLIPSSMEWAGDVIALAEIAGDHMPTHRRGLVYATTSPGRRYVITNRWNIPEINVADVMTRRSWTIPLGTDISINAGVAVNHGWENPGLLAVHASDKIIVYRFDPSFTELSELARVTIPPPLEPRPPHDATGGQVAWSGSGSHLIVSTSSDRAEFALIEVSSCGSHLEVERFWAVCDAESGNGGLDILTANGVLPPPGDFESACPLPVRDEFATATPSPTGTPETGDVHLPFVHSGK